MRNRFSTYTGAIVFANVVAFILFLVLGASIGQQKLIEWIALQPSSFLSGQNVWTLVTHMFMHAGLSHLFVNMLSLLFIGSFVEKLIGKKRFLGLYLGSGLFAGIFFVLVSLIFGIDMNVLAVGASGAIFGLGGLLAILTPRLPVLVFFIIPLPMWAAMVFLMVALWLLSLGLGLPIGNVAHLGGLLVGLGYGLYLRNKFPEKTKIIRKYFSK